jgi:small subunit ribosomal protein S20
VLDVTGARLAGNDCGAAAVMILDSPAPPSTPAPCAALHAALGTAVHAGFWRVLTDLSSGPSVWPAKTAVLYSAAELPRPPALNFSAHSASTRGSSVARKARTWKGARTPQALKRVRQALRRRDVNRRTRSEAKTLTQRAGAIALGRVEGDGPEAITAAISALDRAAEKGIIHRNNAARRKSRLMAKANAAHLLEGVSAESGPKKKSVATKTAQRKKVAAAKASKAAAAKAADRPRTAAGKAKVAVTRASRESAAARRRRQAESGEEPKAEG